MEAEAEAEVGTWRQGDTGAGWPREAGAVGVQFPGSDPNRCCWPRARVSVPRAPGRSIGSEQAGGAAAGAKSASDTAAIHDALASHDYTRAEELLAAAKAGHARRSRVPAATTRLRLQPTNGDAAAAAITLTASGNTTEWQAAFELPASLSPGTYTAHISNGLSSHSRGEWVELSMFQSPTAPNLGVVTVVAPPAWPSKVFTVDCEWDKDVFERPCGWVGARSSEQVNLAIAAAEAAGGGVVYLPRGQYYVDGPIVVPNGTVLRGEAQDQVAIYFREDNPDTTPKPGYIYAAPNATAWGVEDLSVYVSHHYWSVVYVHPACKSFTLQRTRVRAVAWAMLSDPCPGNNGRGNRLANFSRADVGAVVYLNKNDNYRIVDNDLLGSAIIIHTGGHGVTQGGSATYGVVARNMLWNANAAHWFDGIKEVIFEYNTIRPAGTAIAWGNNIDNYGNGYAQHVYHANNDFQCAWGGDREFMTFDPIYGAYFGPAVARGNVLSLATKDHGGNYSDFGDLGGTVSVLGGAGKGQYRRVTGLVGGWNNANATTRLTLDAPFTTPLDHTSLVQVGPFKGLFIFDANKFADGGAVQTYGNAHDVVFSRHVFRRTEGLMAWGRGTGPAIYSPNMRIQFIDNVVEETNHLWNWNATYPYPHPKTIEPYFMGVLGSDQDVQPCVSQIISINHTPARSMGVVILMPLVCAG